MHKTGSTAIQGFFCRHRLLLRALGIRYHRPRGAEGRLRPKAADLFEAVSHEKDHGAAHPHWGPSGAIVEGFGGPGVLVVSAEGLSGPSAAFARACAPLRGRAVAVVALRRPDQWVEAFYRQMVLSREVREARGFAEFLRDPALSRHLDYLAMLEGWAGALGGDALRVLPYPGVGALLPRFLAAAGLPVGLARLPGTGRRENPSLHPGLVEAVRLRNAAGADWVRTGREAALPAAGYFRPEERRSFLASHAPMLARVAEMFGEGAVAFGAPEDPAVWNGRALTLT